MAPNLRLWYREPARVWPNALPIGNGKLGAMVWGQVQKERWQLNEDSVWYGGPRDRNPKDALQYLPELRRLLDKGQLAEAEKLVERAFVAMPESQRHYESLGLANLIFPHKETDARNYKRWLDLETATTGVSYDLGGVCFTRELFASHPANVIAAEFTASKPGMVTFDLRIIRQAGMPIQDRSPDAREMDPQGVDTNIYMDTVTVVDNVLVMKARTGGNGVQMCLTATVTVEGGMFDSPQRTIP
jgi:alpha-L-fucosidase 2